MKDLEDIVGKDLNKLSSKEFSDLIVSKLKSGVVSKEVFVHDRGDGHSGRIDLVQSFEDGKTIAFELDRIKPRKKSIFKLKTYGATESYVIVRSPVNIIAI